MATTTNKVNAQFPDKLQFLFEPHRYKVAYGGRGGAKSWNFARALLILGGQRPLRILCVRETMKSLAESVHKLLSDQIELLGLGDFYHIEKARIFGANGTEFSFAGLKHDPGSLKSSEAVDIAWVEEAQGVSAESWRVLIPTIRKEGSEIWASWNPDFEDDPTYQMFVVNPPPDAVVVKLTWLDNPWFPPVLEQERLHLLATDPDEHDHVWEGAVINLIKSAIYAAELRAVDREERIRSVPYDPSRPVDCFWDLGYGDMTAIWFAQSFPFEYRLIDYIEESGRNIQWYLQQMQSRGYIYGTDWLPWDLGLHAAALGSGKSIEELMRLAGRKVRITPKLSVADGINAARTIFPLCWFDRDRCEQGLRALRHYRYGEVKTTGHVTREPIHDKSSHGSDSFRYFAVIAKPPKPVQKERVSEWGGRRPVTSAWS
jgi:phage terminase large subunit